MKPFRHRHNNGRTVSFLSCASVVVVCLGCDGLQFGDANGEPKSRASFDLVNLGMTVYVPAYYTSSDSTSWTTFFQEVPNAFQGGRQMFVIVNGGHSEPDATFDPVLESHIAQIHANGHYVLGYVDWMPKTGPCDPHARDCNGRWAQLPTPCTGTCMAQYTSDNIIRWATPAFVNGAMHSYNVDGVFIDDAQRDDVADVSNSELLVNLTQVGLNKSFVAFNWGISFPVAAIQTDVDCNIQGANFGKPNFGSLVKWFNYEDTFQNLHDQPTSNYNWSFSYNPAHFIQLGYGYSTAPDWTALDETMNSLSARNAQGVFVTDQVLTDVSGPWDTPPLANLLARQNSNANGGYSYPGQPNDVVQCGGPNGCASSCLNCACPSPLQSSITLLSDYGTGYCVGVNVTNNTSSTINSWTVGVRIDDAVLRTDAYWNSRVDGTTGVILVSSIYSWEAVAPGATNSQTGFCVYRGTPGALPSYVSAVGIH
jgi:hypothetical protein